METQQYTLGHFFFFFLLFFWNHSQLYYILICPRKSKQNKTTPTALSCIRPRVICLNIMFKCNYSQTLCDAKRPQRSAYLLLLLVWNGYSERKLLSSKTSGFQLVSWSNSKTKRYALHILTLQHPLL